MNKEPKYNLPLTENEKELIINSLYLASTIHEFFNHPYVSNRMEKLANRILHLNKDPKSSGSEDK